jgi:transcription elongation factor SPT6
MMRLFKKIQKYRSEKPNENVRVLKDEDIDRLRMVESIEELSDVYNYFILYYGNDVLAMREEYRRNTAARQRLNEDGELMDADDMREDLHDPDEDFYARAGLDGNVVLEYVSPKFSTATEVKGANDMLAEQIAKEPSVRKFVRESFFERARFDVIPTKEGLKKINEMHDLYSLKFLKDKPARDLVDDQFLRLWVAEQDKLLTIVFPTKIEGAITASYVDEIIKALLTRDESSKLVQELNVQRKEIIDLALSKFVLPSMVKELKAKLLNEAQEFVKRACCQQLYNCLNVSFIVTQIFFPFH